jgi:hypothetical protein
LTIINANRGCVEQRCATNYPIFVVTMENDVRTFQKAFVAVGTSMVASFFVPVLVMSGTAGFAALAFVSDADTDQTQWVGVHRGMLAHAVAALEAGSGGKVLEIRLEPKDTGPMFEAVISHEVALAYVRIDPVTDQVVMIDTAVIPEWMAGWKLRADARSIEKAKVPLSQAILLAEKRGEGVAVNAGLAKPLTGGNAVLAYNVEVVRNKRADRLAIDATTGHPIANPDALYDPWTPSKLVKKILPQ